MQIHQNNNNNNNQFRAKHQALIRKTKHEIESGHSNDRISSNTNSNHRFIQQFRLIQHKKEYEPEDLHRQNYKEREGGRDEIDRRRPGRER